MSEPLPAGSGTSLAGNAVGNRAPARRHGRRALILGAAAAGAGITAGLVSGAVPAAASNGNPVLLGESTTASATTSVTTTGGTGVSGVSTNGHGVFG